MPRAATQRTRHLAAGDKLGKYEVIRQIAVGGMAEIYLARTLGIEGFEKLVVVKRILPQYVTNASFVEMFLNEARLAATLHHTNVAQVYDIGVDEGDYFFAMEYVHGEDLDHISSAAEEQGVPVSLDAALTLVAGLCAGLHYAHDKANAVHRDVSPSNVLVSYDGAIKLVDFGIARASSRPGTTHGGLKGKIAYMSPEQCRAKAQLDRRSDLYAVGTILYELSTGQLPFSGESEYQVLHQIVNEDVPPPSTVVPGYPKRLEYIVLRALARDVDQRYPSALELQADVEDFAHESRLRISPLVLARLMGTLFPSRLEEWDHAKTQGGFFLEQHVVQTLIESGKASEPTDPALSGVEQPIHGFAVDDSTTELNQRPVADHSEGGDHSDSSFGAAPITAVREPRAFPPLRSEVDVVPLPPPPELDRRASSDPRPERPYPMVSELMSASPGALVTSVGKYGGVPVTVTTTRADVTERVRARRSSPTAFVRGPPRRPVFAMICLVALGGALAAFIALRPRAAPRPTPAAVDSPPRQMQLLPAESAAVEPAPVERMPVEPAPVEPAQRKAPPVKPPPVKAPPVDSPPVKAPPAETSPVDTSLTKTPPVKARPVKAPPVKAPPVKAPPENAPQVRALPVKALPVKAPLVKKPALVKKKPESHP